MSSLLYPNECLVYIKSSTAFSNTDGSVYIAELLREFTLDNIEYGEFALINDPEGLFIASPRKAFAPLSSIVSNRTPTLIPGNAPVSFYHYSSNEITSTSYILPNKTCLETSRSGYGSGVYGIYSDSYEDALSIKGKDQNIYTIVCKNPYYLQDKEHGCSLTIASLQTSSYIDMIFPIIMSNSTTLEGITEIISLNDIDFLLILWNTVFYRTSPNNMLTKEDLHTILKNYIYNKIESTDVLYHLPINDILSHYGYDGILSIDTYNNTWTRGCISYNLHPSYQIIGTSSTY